jgi:hypothetical protein
VHIERNRAQIHPSLHTRNTRYQAQALEQLREVSKRVLRRGRGRGRGRLPRLLLAHRRLPRRPRGRRLLRRRAEVVRCARCAGEGDRAEDGPARRRGAALRVWQPGGGEARAPERAVRLLYVCGLRGRLRGVCGLRAIRRLSGPRWRGCGAVEQAEEVGHARRLLGCRLWRRLLLGREHALGLLGRRGETRERVRVVKVDEAARARGGARELGRDGAGGVVAGLEGGVAREDGVERVVQLQERVCARCISEGSGEGGRADRGTRSRRRRHR